MYTHTVGHAEVARIFYLLCYLKHANESSQPRLSHTTMVTTLGYSVCSVTLVTNKKLVTYSLSPLHFTKHFSDSTRVEFGQPKCFTSYN